MRSEAEAVRVLEKYGDTVRRVCFIHLKNTHDVEDIFQEVFMKYILNDKNFESEAHEKAWLIRVALNACKDAHKSFFRRKTSALEEAEAVEFYIPEESRAVLAAILSLPDNYKAVIYLFYYEGYTAPEIAEIIHKNPNTVYTWLSRAKSRLRDLLGGETFDR